MTLNDIEQIYYIQKEEFQLGTTTVYAPTFFIDYNFAKKEFEELIELEKKTLHYIEKETKALDCIVITGADNWGKTEIRLWLRSNRLNKEQIK
ncbi:Uncharacterised protein [uncultured Clostridium sp.]|nr:Uncharacterised protein [uncultured Clostridium sp.]SCJ55454.1 Uncharacterised protein [uncultured Clostridium sp.]